MLALRIFAIVICLCFFLYVIYKIKKGQLLLKYSLLWLLLSLVILLFSIFPEPIYFMASMFGFEVASNFVFFVGLFFVIAIVLSLTIIVSKQSIMIKTLTQQIALDEHGIKRKEAMTANSEQIQNVEQLGVK